MLVYQEWDVRCLSWYGIMHSARCLQHPERRRKHLAVWLCNARHTHSGAEWLRLLFHLASRIHQLRAYRNMSMAHSSRASSHNPTWQPPSAQNHFSRVWCLSSTV